MQVPNGNHRTTDSSSLRVREQGLVLPTPPTPLGDYVEPFDAGNLLFLSGMLPLAKVSRNLATLSSGSVITYVQNNPFIYREKLVTMIVIGYSTWQY
jgi:hypothetical protein